MVSGDQRNHLGFVRLETPEVPVLDQVVRVTMVPLIADVDPDIVQECPIFQPLPLALAKAMGRARLVEDAQCQARDLLRMLRPVAASFP